QHLRTGSRDRLGQRRHQRDHPPHRPDQSYRGTEVVGDVIHPDHNSTVDVGGVHLDLHSQQAGACAMTVTQIDLDDDALQQTMALSGVRTKKEAVNLALRYYVEQQKRAAKAAYHFEKARHWGAVEDAEKLHRAEKAAR